jgi:hypothetical protein
VPEDSWNEERRHHREDHGTEYRDAETMAPDWMNPAISFIQSVADLPRTSRLVPGNNNAAAPRRSQLNDAFHAGVLIRAAT